MMPSNAGGVLIMCVLRNANAIDMDAPSRRMREQIGKCTKIRKGHREESTAAHVWLDILNFVLVGSEQVLISC